MKSALTAIILAACLTFSFSRPAFAQYPNNCNLEQATSASLFGGTVQGVLGNGVLDSNSVADTSAWADFSLWKTFGYDIESDTICKVNTTLQFQAAGEPYWNTYTDSIINTGTGFGFQQRVLQGYSSSSTVTVPKGAAKVRMIAKFQASGNPAGKYKFYAYIFGLH